MATENTEQKEPDNGKFRPNKLLGQNFLIDKNIRRKIIDAADLRSGDIVLEIGPGAGFLTAELIKRAGRVIAAEKDAQLAVLLAEKFAAAKNLEIIKNDILILLRDKSFLAGQRYKVVANIPYYLTSRLIRLLLESANPPREIILTIQKEVALRLCAQPPKMTLLAAATQFYAQPKIIAPVSKNSFRPIPRVDSAIIKITPWPRWQRQIQPEQFFKIVRAGFSHPRKQLANNLTKELNIAPEKISSAFTAANLKNNQRAETLSIADWLVLAQNSIFQLARHSDPIS